MTPRAAAARVLREVCSRGRSLSAVLSVQASHVAEGDRALLQELCYGVLRWQPRLDFLLRQLLRKPLKERDGEIRWLLLLGLYQILFMRVPAHAAVAASVAAAAELDRPGLKGLVNGVLRNFLRRRESLLGRCAADETAHFAHPAWFIAMLREAWPEDWQAILAANNARPPLVLRVNRLRASRDICRTELAEAGLAARPLRHVPTGLVLARAVDVTRLPGFAEGLLSVQDGAAQLAAGLLDLAPGQRVLDACAAPGGKTCHILETEPGLAEVVALDSDAMRCEKIEENLQRLGLRAQVVCGDAATPAQWWDGRPFDRILLDAPCTASGIVRRRPDIKCQRRADDVTSLAAQQKRLLQGLWPLLKGGGMLLYATCSVFPRENVAQMQAFFAACSDAQHCPIVAPWGRALAVGRQILPGEAGGEDGMDGFYYALAKKRSARGR